MIRKNCHNHPPKVKAKKILGIIIDKYLTFTPHVDHITKKCKMNTIG